MKKIVRIKESQLNGIIKKVIKEQGEDQFMTSGPKPEEMAGAPEDETSPESEGPNFEEFITCAKGLLDQGSTIGELVDQLLNAQSEPEGEEEPEMEPETEPEPEEEPVPPMNESKKRRK